MRRASDIGEMYREKNAFYEAFYVSAMHAVYFYCSHSNFINRIDIYTYHILRRSPC